MMTSTRGPRANAVSTVATRTRAPRARAATAIATLSRKIAAPMDSAVPRTSAVVTTSSGPTPTPATITVAMPLANSTSPTSHTMTNATRRRLAGRGSSASTTVAPRCGAASTGQERTMRDPRRGSGIVGGSGL